MGRGDMIKSVCLSICEHISGITLHNFLSRTKARPRDMTTHQPQAIGCIWDELSSYGIWVIPLAFIHTSSTPKLEIYFHSMGFPWDSHSHWQSQPNFHRIYHASYHARSSVLLYWRRVIGCLHETIVGATGCADTIAPCIHAITLWSSCSFMDDAMLAHRGHHEKATRKRRIYMRWQWRSFVPYLCQLVFAAIVWVKPLEMFVTLMSLKYPRL